MSAEAASLALRWESTFAEAVPADQRWVLSAMQSHGPALVNMLWRILADEADVCDAYQDTFLQLAHYEQGRKPDNVKAFVFRSASNVAISMLRRKRLHARACRAMAARVKEHEHVDYGEDLDSRQLQETLREQIARLPDQLRAVVLLKDLADMSYSQVAKILDVSVATARVYRCRAVRMLARWMVPEDGG